MSERFIGPHAVEDQVVQIGRSLFEELMTEVDQGTLTMDNALEELRAANDADHLLGKLALSA